MKRCVLLLTLTTLMAMLVNLMPVNVVRAVGASGADSFGSHGGSLNGWPVAKAKGLAAAEVEASAMASLAYTVNPVSPSGSCDVQISVLGLASDQFFSVVLGYQTSTDARAEATMSDTVFSSGSLSGTYVAVLPDAVTVTSAALVVDQQVVASAPAGQACGAVGPVAFAYSTQTPDGSGGCDVRITVQNLPPRTVFQAVFAFEFPADGETGATFSDEASDAGSFDGYAVNLFPRDTTVSSAVLVVDGRPLLTAAAGQRCGSASVGDLFACEDFATKEDAQAVYDFDPSDPNQLDGSEHDGVVCENTQRGNLTFNDYLNVIGAGPTATVAPVEPTATISPNEPTEPASEALPDTTARTPVVDSGRGNDAGSDPGAGVNSAVSLPNTGIGATRPASDSTLALLVILCAGAAITLGTLGSRHRRRS